VKFLRLTVVVLVAAGLVSLLMAGCANKKAENKNEANVKATSSQSGAAGVAGVAETTPK
jgi:hypothetical protein